MFTQSLTNCVKFDTLMIVVATDICAQRGPRYFANGQWWCPAICLLLICYVVPVSRSVFIPIHASMVVIICSLGSNHSPCFRCSAILWRVTCRVIRLAHFERLGTIPKCDREVF